MVMPLTRRQFLAASALPAVGMWAAARKPNVLVIVADDLGYGELGCQGNKQIPTPNIDSLARNGVRFTDGYVTAPVCSPSRAGLMTGRYQTRFGHELNAIGLQNKRPDVGLPLTEETIANRLKSVGYATGLVGKWHLGGTPKFHPMKRGFDEFFGFLHEGHFYVPPSQKDIASHLRDPEPAYDLENPILRGTEPFPEQDYLTEAFTREGVSFIDRHYKQPFLLVLTYNAIHSPMQAKPEYMKRFDYIEDQHRRVFAAMLASLDDGVGALLGRLREKKIEEDTLIFFVSDNGGPTRELTSSNKPLRGGKGQLWEGGIRTPSMVQWKSHLPAGKEYPHPEISTDIFATASAVAGAKGRAVDGVNLLPYLTGQNKSAPHDILFWRYGRSIAVRRGNWKLVRQPEAGNTAFQLFDLSRDIAETRNLASEKPELVEELQTALTQLNAQMVEPLWGGRAAKK
jgi:arylsulfatase A-like enzyme